jgi:mono/diheme cytochrome c family protein
MAPRNPVASPRWSRYGLAFATVLAATAALLAVMAEPPAQAKSRFLSEFGQVYPAAAASQLNGCLLCHTSPNPSGDNKARNPYGDDWEEVGDGDFRAIESRDSDRDGFTNLQEIQALSFPGDPSSTPLTVTTTTTVPGQAPDGAALYAASCAACHGSGGGNLRNTTLSGQQFTSVVVNGKGSAMPGFGTALSDAQIAAIYAYVTGAPAPTTTTIAPGTPIDAGALYAGTCAGCHGAGGGNLVPTGLSSAQLVSVITNGRGGMPSYGPTLSAGQIQALADYLLSRSAAPTTTAAPGTPPRSGAAVFTSSCAVCHGSSGGNLVGTTLTKSQLVTVITNGVGTMTGFAGRLPAAEIDAVASYLRSLAASTTTTVPGTPPNGGNLFMQLCSVCHGLHGEGGSGGALTGVSATNPELEAIIADGTGSMPGFRSKLTTDELAAVVAFVGDLSGGAGASGSGDGGDEGGLVAGSTTSSSSTTTTGAVAIASPAPDVFSIPAPETEDSGRSGSPWIPVVTIVVVAGWVITDAVRHGHLALPRVPGLFGLIRR